MGFRLENPIKQRPKPPFDGSQCRLLAAPGNDLSEGFLQPFKIARLAPTTGVLRAGLVFVDFSDAPANDSTQSLYDTLLPGAADWFAASSYGKLRLDVQTDFSRFWRMPRPSGEYGWTRAGARQSLYIQDAVKVLGREAAGLRKADVLFIVPTRKAELISFSPTSMRSVTLGNGAQFGAVVTFGQDLHWKWGYKVLNHETGHTMGLPDLYPSDSTGLPRGAWAAGFDIMGLINGTSPELLAWHKWKFSWIDDAQVRCVTTPGKSSHVVSPIEVPGGVKMVAVKLNQTVAIALEVRTKSGHNAGACVEGLLPYRVDTLGTNSKSPPILVLDAHEEKVGCHLNRGGILNGAPFDYNKNETKMVLKEFGIVVKITGVEKGDYHLDVAWEPQPVKQIVVEDDDDD
jgi:M6 family metalloprotease-like protein